MPRDDHVKTQQEKYADSVRPLADKLLTDSLKNWETDYHKKAILKLREAFCASLGNLMLHTFHTEWAANVRHGISLGRKDAVVMLQSLPRTGIIDKKGIRTDYVTVAEVDKIIQQLGRDTSKDPVVLDKPTDAERRRIVEGAA